jgi:DNA-binding PadR family transcriptional regulator
MSSATTRMLVLGLLAGRPMHGYQITQVTAQAALDRWAAVLPGSVYHALTKLESEGLVRAEAEERTGDRVRTVYAITDVGREGLLALLRDALSHPPHDLRSDLALASVWLPLLDRHEVVELLGQARVAIETAQQQRDVGRRAKSGLSPVAGLLFDNADAIAQADLRLLDQLDATLRAEEPV